MEELKRIKGNFYDACINATNSMIVLIKSTKVLICDSKDHSLQTEILFKNCVSCVFFENLIVLKNATVLEVYEISSGEKIFRKIIGKGDGYKIVLKDACLICGDFQNNNYFIDLKTLGCEKFKFKEGSCLYLDKNKDGFLALINRDPLDDTVELIQYDRKLEIVSKIGEIPKISCLTFQAIGDRAFFVENNKLQYYNMEQESRVNGCLLDFLPVYSDKTARYYLISNHFTTKIFSLDLQETFKFESESIFDAHTVKMIDNKLLIFWKNRIYIEVLEDIKK